MRCPTAWGSAPGFTTKTRAEAVTAVALGVAPAGRTEASPGLATDPQAPPREASDARSARPRSDRFIAFEDETPIAAPGNAARGAAISRARPPPRRTRPRRWPDRWRPAARTAGAGSPAPWTCPGTGTGWAPACRTTAGAP